MRPEYEITGDAISGQVDYLIKVSENDLFLLDIFIHEMELFF